MPQTKCVLITGLVLLAIVLPIWLAGNGLQSIGSEAGFINKDVDSLFYYRIIDQAYAKGSSSYVLYDNYGNFPYKFKIGYPRLYFWLLYWVKVLCNKVYPANPDLLLWGFPVLTTTLTALIIFIGLWYLGYSPTFLLLCAFALLPSASALQVGVYGKIDYDHVLSLYMWLWLLLAMFYMDRPSKKILVCGGIAASLILGSWIGSLLIFFVITLSCIALWFCNSDLCKGYLSYCYTTFGIATAVNIAIMLCSLSTYGITMLDFGYIHISAMVVATIGVWFITRVQPSTKNRIVALSSVVIVVGLFAIIDTADFTDIIERVSGVDPVFLDITELAPVLEFKNLYKNINSIEKLINIYGLAAFLMPVFFFVPAKKLFNRNSASVLQLWLSIAILASFYQNRYVRLLGVGNCLYAAFVLYLVWKGLSGLVAEAKLTKLRAACAFCILLLVVRVPAIWTYLGFTVEDRKSDMLAFDWIKKNTPPTSGYSDDKDPEYGILAYWDHGHVITHFAHRPTLANNMQNGIKNMADIFSSTDEETANQICKELKARYVYIQPDRVLYPKSMDYWPAYRNQPRKPGYTALSSNVERSKDYEEWFYTWIMSDYGLRKRGKFGVAQHFRVVFANEETKISGFSNLLMERVDGAKVVLRGRPGTTAEMSIGVTILNKYCVYKNTQTVDNDGFVRFNLPYSCWFNNGVVSTGELYEISITPEGKNHPVTGKVRISEEAVMNGNQIATTTIILFNR